MRSRRFVRPTVKQPVQERARQSAGLLTADARMSTPASIDPAWLDAQYNPRAAVPDHERFFERWRLDSARAREQADCLLDLAYGDTSAETLDVYARLQAVSARRAWRVTPRYTRWRGDMG